jgi:hypothetical protein
MEVSVCDRRFYGVIPFPVELRVHITQAIYDAGTPMTDVGRQVLGYMRYVSLIPGVQEFQYAITDGEILRRRSGNRTVLEFQSSYQTVPIVSDLDKKHFTDVLHTTI